MKTNELRKGTRIILRNGWKAEIADNAKGNIRMAKVYGIETEIGSVYSHDITAAIVDGRFVPIEHTPAQLTLRAMVGESAYDPEG